MMKNAKKSDSNNDAPQIESHRRDRAGVVRELRRRRPDAIVRASDGSELHGHHGAAGPHLPRGVGPDQGEKDSYIRRQLFLSVAYSTDPLRFFFPFQGKSAEEIRRIFNIEEDQVRED